MADLNPERPLLPTRVAIKPGEKQLLAQANQRASALHENSGVPGTDPRGMALRQLRIERQLDPASLATQACISVPQLLQLENGESSLFYSEGLRNQTGRRVAALLGADWDALATPGHHEK